MTVVHENKTREHGQSVVDAITRAPVYRYLAPADRAALPIYLGFLVRAILPIVDDADAFYRAHAMVIGDVAQSLRRLIGYVERPLYRGLILNDDELEAGSLPPRAALQYLCFSESRGVAQRFADPHDDISTFVRVQKPRARGYVIEYQAPVEEVLFSWHWADLISLHDLQVPGWQREVLESQQEIIVRQAGRWFDLIPQ